jgi:hypothetical protein
MGFATKVGEPAPTARNVMAWGNAQVSVKVRSKKSAEGAK